LCIIERPDSGLIANAIERYFNESLKSRFQEAIGLEKQQHSWSNFALKLIEFAADLKR